jgi:hypothetical protein
VARIAKRVPARKHSLPPAGQTLLISRQATARGVGGEAKSAGTDWTGPGTPSKNP